MKLLCLSDYSIISSLTFIRKSVIFIIAVGMTSSFLSTSDVYRVIFHHCITTIINNDLFFIAAYWIKIKNFRKFGPL